MRWSTTSDPLMVLHAKPSLMKNKYPTCQFHHKGESIIQGKGKPLEAPFSS